MRYSTATLAKLLAVSEQTVRKRFQKLPRYKRRSRGGGWEYELHDLPQHIQALLVEGSSICHQARPEYVELVPNTFKTNGSNYYNGFVGKGDCLTSSRPIHREAPPKAIAPQPTSVKVIGASTDQSGEDLRSLPEIQPLPEVGVEATPVGDKKQQERDAKLSILTMLEDFCAKHAIGICKAREEFAKRFNQKAIAVADWIRQHISSISVPTLSRWQKALRASGNPNVLLRRQGKSRKRKSILDTNAQMRAVVEGMLLYRSDHIEAELLERGFENVPSLRTIERWVKRWRQENPALYAALQNKHLYNSKYRPAFGSVTEDVIHANQRWQIDATKADIRLEDGSRYSILLIVDAFSRRLKAFVSKTSNAKNLVQGMLRRAILSWGVPNEIDHDLGKEFLSAYFLGCLSALDINNRPCNAFSPWEKGNVERAFGSMTRELFERLPGFCGHNVAQAQAIRSHGTEDIELRLTPEELQKRLDEWCHEYEQRPHQGLDGKPPRFAMGRIASANQKK